MKKRQFSTYFLLGLFLILLLPFSALAAPPAQEPGDCAEEYTVQADDWLSKIAAYLILTLALAS